MIPPANLPTPLVPPTSRLDAYQPGVQEGNGIGQAFNAAMDGFSARSAQMQSSIRDAAARDTWTGDGARPSAADPAAPASTVPRSAVLEVRGGKPGPVALMVDCFNFAIEASLVSRAATQFTGSVSTLMKGQ